MAGWLNHVIHFLTMPVAGTKTVARKVTAAKEATAEFGKPAWLAGSLSPFEDCYRPDLVPTADECLD